MRHTVATQGDRLDQIIYTVYKTLSVMNEVMINNSHLMNKPILDDGDIVYLPDIAISLQPVQGVSLW